MQRELGKPRSQIATISTQKPCCAGVPLHETTKAIELRFVPPSVSAGQLGLKLGEHRCDLRNEHRSGRIRRPRMSVTRVCANRRMRIDAFDRHWQVQLECGSAS